MPFSLFTIRNFLRGVVLLGLPDSIPEGTFRKAINIRIDRTLGSITNRPGWTKLSSNVVASGAITWISKLFGSTTDFSYAHIGSEIYRDTDAWAGTGTDITTTSAGSAKISVPVNAELTASTTQTQGGGLALTAEVNEISTCANADDTVVLPTAVAGLKIVLLNNGVQQMRIFPASADNLGAGVDTADATALAAGSNRVYVAYDATNWEII